MPAHKETAPAETTGRAPKLVRCDGLNVSGGILSRENFQGSTSDLEDCLAAALDYERALARRQYRIRKFILNLQCKLDALEELSARSPGTESGMSYCELDVIEGWLKRYVHYTDDHCLTTHVLWCAHAHLMEHWDISPRLGFFSAMPGSGKTNALMLTSYLCAPPDRAGNVSISVSPATLARQGEDAAGRAPDIQPQFLDEIDNLYNAASKDGSADLTTAILNGGYKRGNSYERMVGANRDQVKRFGIFGAVGIAGLGRARLPDSLSDRLLRIPMEPIKSGESVERFRQRILEGEHRSYRDALWEFCDRADGKIDIESVAIPEALSGRDIDNWEPLLAVGEVAGNDWAARGRRAAMWFCALKAMTKRDSLALRLLKEVVEYLQEVTKAETAQIYQHLCNKSGAPWRDLKFFNESWIRETLYQFPGAPRQGDVRISQGRVQGFHVDWFADLIERYISPEVTPDTPDNIDNKNKAVGPVGSVAASVIPIRPIEIEPPESHIDDWHVFQERAGILEHEAGLCRADAEARATRDSWPKLPDFDRRKGAA